MKNTKNFLTNHLIMAMIIGIVIAAVGIYVVCQSEGFLKIVIVILGILGILNGIVSLFAISKYISTPKTRVLNTIKGVLNILIGFFILVYPYFFANLAGWIIFIVLAVQLLISSLVSFWDAFMLRKVRMPFQTEIFEAVIELILSLILFIFPNFVGMVFIKAIGIILILIGISVFVWTFRLFRLSRRVNADTEIEASYEIKNDD